MTIIISLDTMAPVTGNLKLPADGDKPERLVSVSTLQQLAQARSWTALANLGVAAMLDAEAPEGKVRVGEPRLVKRANGRYERVWTLEDAPEEVDLPARVTELEGMIADLSAEITALKGGR